MPDPSSTRASGGRHIRWLGVLSAVAGLGLLVVIIRRVGWNEVAAALSSLGWAFGLVVILGGARFAARARSWVACADARAFRFGPAFRAVLAGDALGNVTPLGLFASEPAKVLLARRYLSTADGVASVAADNVFYTLSVLLMLVAGTLVFLRRAAVPESLQIAADLVLAGAAAGALAVFLVARHRPAALSRMAELAARWTGRAARSASFARDIEAGFYGLLEWPAARLLAITGWQILFHVAAVAEVYLVLRLLPGSTHAGLIDAFLLETTGRLVTVVFKVVPYRLGVDEAGSAVVARALAMDPSVGVALALVRRLRILVWNGVGLVLLARGR